MEYLRPRRTQIMPNPLYPTVHPNHPWRAIVSRPGLSAFANFLTEEEALIWAARFKFQSPSVDEVTMNGRFSCE